MRFESRPPPKLIASSWPGERLTLTKRETRSQKRTSLLDWKTYQPGKRSARAALIGCDRAES